MIRTRSTISGANADTADGGVRRDRGLASNVDGNPCAAGPECRPSIRNRSVKAEELMAASAHNPFQFRPSRFGTSRCDTIPQQIALTTFSCDLRSRACPLWRAVTWCPERRPSRSARADAISGRRGGAGARFAKINTLRQQSLNYGKIADDFIDLATPDQPAAASAATWPPPACAPAGCGSSAPANRGRFAGRRPAHRHRAARSD